ncbi:hypothetical protein ABK040_016658 [Willaertia magna]
MNFSNHFDCEPFEHDKLLFSISDGVGNEYYILGWKEEESDNSIYYHFVYDPITKMESCSGEYSGGDSFEARLSNKMFERIKKLIFNLQKNNCDTTTNNVETQKYRMKGECHISIYQKNLYLLSSTNNSSFEGLEVDYFSGYFISNSNYNDLINCLKNQKGNNTRIVLWESKYHDGSEIEVGIEQKANSCCNLQ